VSTSGYYKWINKDRPEHCNFDSTLADLILDIFNENLKGYRYINDELKRRYGLIINDKTVLRYMQILGIQSPIRKKRFKSCTIREINEKSRIVMPNVLDRKFEASRPLEKLVTDVSYIYHEGGRLYLSVVKDLYDNSIVSYQISKFNDMKLVMDTVNQFIDEYYEQLPFLGLIHSDQGFQYTNRQYINLLNDNLIIVSHSRKGNCLDNAPMENWFSHLKSESLELNVPVNELDLFYRVEEFIMYYNNERHQRKLKSMTPIEFRYHA